MDLDSLTPQQLDGLRRFLVVLEGGDPESQQTLNKFMNIDNPIERTNLPTRRDVHVVSYLDMVNKSYFPTMKNDPFSLLNESISIGFMAKGGMKSNQVVELLRNSPDLAAFQTAMQIQDSQNQQGFMSRFLGRGKRE